MKKNSITGSPYGCSGCKNFVILGDSTIMPTAKCKGDANSPLFNYRNSERPAWCPKDKKPSNGVSLKFEKGYFVHSETSNYKDYRNKKFESLAKDLVHVLKLKPSNRVLDFGSATGGLIYHLKKIGIIDIIGTDISFWAITYGKENYKLDKELKYFNVDLLTEKFDCILLLDVLEHVPTVAEIKQYLAFISKNKPVQIAFRVPVCKFEGEPYVLEVSRNDITHVQCRTKEWWRNLFAEFGFELKYFITESSIYDSEGVLAAVFV